MLGIWFVSKLSEQNGSISKPASSQTRPTLSASTSRGHNYDSSGETRSNAGAFSPYGTHPANPNSLTIPRAIPVKPTDSPTVLRAIPVEPTAPPGSPSTTPLVATYRVVNAMRRTAFLICARHRAPHPEWLSKFVLGQGELGLARVGVTGRRFGGKSRWGLTPVGLTRFISKRKARHLETSNARRHGDGLSIRDSCLRQPKHQARLHHNLRSVSSNGMMRSTARFDLRMRISPERKHARQVA
jgi:hypothetical protein